MTEPQLWDTLMRFHQEVALPSIVGPLRNEFRDEIRVLRDDMNSHFDAIYLRLDRLEGGATSLTLRFSAHENDLCRPRRSRALSPRPR